MKRTILALGLCTQLHAEGIEGWIYAGPMGKQITFKDHAFLLNNGITPEEDIDTFKLHSFGGQVGVGLLFPLPVFIGFEGAWSHLYNSHFAETTLLEGSPPSFLSNLLIKGNMYTYEVYAGYLFQPLCDFPWSLYPLLTYGSDTVVVKAPTFPLGLPPEVTIDKLYIREHFSFKGPGVGFGTNISFWGLLLTGESSWQFRELKMNGTNVIILNFPSDFFLFNKQHSETLTWLQGPKCRLSLDYDYCGWFAGISGEWQYLWQLSGSEGAQGQSNTQVDSTGAVVQYQAYETFQIIKKAEWTAWAWKAYLGYAF